MSFAAGRALRPLLNSSNTLLSNNPDGIGSAPALAAAIRHTHQRMELATPIRTVLRRDPVVQIYQVTSGSAGSGPAGGSPAGGGLAANGVAGTRSVVNGLVTHGTVENEAQSAAQMIIAVTERLRRLRVAYGAWRHFDAPAYFDLSEVQTDRLLQIQERVTMVHLVFYADALLPSFQAAEAFWQEDFRPHYLDLRNHLRQGDLPLAPVMTFADRSQPQMLEHWQRLDATIRSTRALLDNEVDFLTANGSNDERLRWRWAWSVDPAPGIRPELLPSLAQTPTLTLGVDFPLPIYRQPGRRRRLAERHQRGMLRYRSGE